MEGSRKEKREKKCSDRRKIKRRKRRASRRRSDLEDNSGEMSSEVRIIQIPMSLNVIWRSLVMLERTSLVQGFTY